MRKQKLTPTTKTVDDLYQLHAEGRLDLRPDYQRNSVWPPKARAYLVDTVLMDRPIPMLFVSRTRDANTNKMSYRVIDGQQRLRAVFAYLENRFGANESEPEEIKGKRYKRLPSDYQDQFLGYSFVVMEISGFSETELRDIFARINKYVVRLNNQELRDAKKPGPFKNFIDELSGDPVWGGLGLFSKAGLDRKRNKEFIAELTVLLMDGPQDKKGSLDLYYAASPEQFEDAEQIRQSILRAAGFAKQLISEHRVDVFRKLPAFYGLMGSLYRILEDDESMVALESRVLQARDSLAGFAEFVDSLPANPKEFLNERDVPPEAVARAYRFKDSLSRQTDNVKPRTSRIEAVASVLEDVLLPDKQ